MQFGQPKTFGDSAPSRFPGAPAPQSSSDYNSTLTEEPEPGHAMEIDKGDLRLLIQPDGSVIVEDKTVVDEPRVPKKGDHDENLAAYLTKNQRARIANELIEYADFDRDSRKDWAERECAALEMLGVKDIPDTSIGYPSIHKVVHPMIADAATQFQARAIQEFFPASGPVKCTAFGKADEQTEEQAERVEDGMNYYLTEEDEGYFEDMDQMLFYLPLAGSAFKLITIDEETGLPISRYIKASDFLVPYSATSLARSSRYAHQYQMLHNSILRAQDNGYFIECPVLDPGAITTQGRRLADEADGREQNMPEDDRVHNMLRYFVDMPIEGINPEDNRVKRPYVVVVDESTTEIYSIRRNWRKDDPKFKRRSWAIHYKYLPGLGFYGFGLLHIIGSLGQAASNAVNALLDAAFACNMQGGFKTKEGSKIAGELRITHGTWKDVDASYEDLSKSFFTPPFKEPAPALFQLLGALVDAGNKFASITEVMTGNADNKGPVGTTVALIEEGSRVYTAIHKRMHASARLEFKALGALIHDYMPNEYPFDANGKTRYLMKSDFDGRHQIAPVSDPNIFSQTQRIALAQAVLELQQQNPQIYSKKKIVEAHKRMIQALRVPDPEGVEPEEQTPVYLDPVSENQMILTGGSVQAYPMQNHQAHIAVHQNFLADMQTKMPPAQFQQLQLITFAHMADHIGYQYRNEVIQQLGVPLPPFDPDQGNDQTPLPPDLEAKISLAVAAHPLAIQQPAPQPGQGAQGAPAEPSPEELAARENKRQDLIAAGKIHRDSIGFAAEQRRKETDHRVKLSRDNEAAAAEQKRKDVAAAADVIRSGEKSRVANLSSVRSAHIKNLASLTKERMTLEHKHADHVLGQAHDADAHQREQARAAESHDQTQEQAGESHEQTLEQQQESADAAAKQAKEAADASSSEGG